MPNPVTSGHFKRTTNLGPLTPMSARQFPLSTNETFESLSRLPRSVRSASKRRPQLRKPGQLLVRRPRAGGTCLVPTASEFLETGDEPLRKTVVKLGAGVVERLRSPRGRGHVEGQPLRLRP
jgi:hypothetical protein